MDATLIYAVKWMDFLYLPLRKIVVNSMTGAILRVTFWSPVINVLLENGKTVQFATLAIYVRF